VRREGTSSVGEVGDGEVDVEDEASEMRCCSLFCSHLILYFGLGLFYSFFLYIMFCPIPFPAVFFLYSPYYFV
jgi:hypothetical protein